MSDQPEFETAEALATRPAQPRWAMLLTRASFALGSVALLVAMASEAVAVAGRHLGLPLLGSIEIVQACVVVAASAAMVGATVERGHAAAHVIVERLSPRWQGVLARLADVFGALLFTAFAAGSVWLLSDLWNGQEMTELLHIPLRWLRLFWCLCAALVACLFLASAFSKRQVKTAGGHH